MSKSYTFFIVRLAFIAGLALFGQQLAGQTKTWTNLNATGLWSDAGNWTPAGAPGAANNVVFDNTSSANCVVNVNPTIASLEIKSSYGGTVNLGTRTLTTGGDFKVAAVSQLSSGMGSKVIFRGPGRIECVPPIYEAQINTIQATDDILLREILNVAKLTITQVDLLDGDDIRVSQQIVNNDAALDGDAILSAAGACTFAGNGIRYLKVEPGASLQLLSDLSLERDFELTGSGNITGSGKLILASNGRLDYLGNVAANVEVNTSDPAHQIVLLENFNVSGGLTISQVGEFTGFGDIRASSDITVNDPNIGTRVTVVATGSGNLSGSGALRYLTVEAGATLQLASDFILDKSFVLTGGGTITGSNKLIFASAGRTEFTGSISNVEINDLTAGRAINVRQILNITNDLTITKINDIVSNDVRVGGDIIITDNQVGGSAALVMTGSGTSRFQGAGNGDYPTLIINKNSASDEVQLNSSDFFTEIIVRNGVMDLNNQSVDAFVTVESGGTLVGEGTISGSINGLAGGKVVPGNSPGTMTIDGDVDILGTLFMEITGPGENNGGTAGSDFDQLIVSGNVTIGTMDITFIGMIGPTFPMSGDEYTLIDASSITDGGLNITPGNVNASYNAGLLTVSDPALPIELLYFTATAKGRTVAVEWATATERSNDYMAVERSADGAKFEELGRVKGAGASTETRKYAFTDDKPLEGINYYRLRQVDFDGAFEYHPVVSVVLKGKDGGLALQAYPNPAQSTLQARWAPHPSQVTHLSLTDIEGRRLAEHHIPAGAETYELQLGKLPAGMYFLQARQGEKAEVVQVVKE